MSNTITITQSGLTKSQQEKMNFVEFKAIKKVGRKFDIGDTLLIPDDQVLYYHEMGWISLNVEQAKYYLEKQRELDDEQALEQERVLSISPQSITVAQAKQELKEELMGAVVPVDDVQKMIDSAVAKALAEAEAKAKKEK